MIYPTLRIEIFAKTGTDGFSQPVYARRPDERVCPVRLSFKSAHTTVRTDSAGSKGHVTEAAAQVVVLAVPKTAIKIDDRLVIMGNSVRVIEIHPRFSVGGALDHHEVHCTAWV